MLKSKLVKGIKRGKRAYTEAIKLVEGLPSTWVHDLFVTAGVNGHDGNFVITISKGADETPFYGEFVQYLQGRGYAPAPAPVGDWGEHGWVMINEELEHVIVLRQAVR